MPFTLPRVREYTDAQCTMHNAHGGGVASVLGIHLHNLIWKSKIEGLDSKICRPMFKKQEIQRFLTLSLI